MPKPKSHKAPNEKPHRQSVRGRPSLSKEMILSAAMEIIEQQGVDFLSMRNIAKKLKCSVAGPYFYFKNQDEIIRGIIAQGEAKLTSQLRAARAGCTDVYDQLTAVAHTYWNFAKENKEIHKLIFNIGGHRKVFVIISPSYRVYLETLRSGIKSGAIRYSIRGYHEIARAMWAWMYGLIVLELTGMLHHSSRESDHVEEGFRCFRRLLLAGEENPGSPDKIH